jgi:dTDP-4-amino-4,6-dideoxygalactose transaminase
MVQLNKIDDQIKHRNNLVGLYKEELGKHFCFQELPSYVSKHPYLFFGIMVRKNERDSLAKHLIKNDIDIRICWLPAHMQKYHKKLFSNISLPGAEEVANNVIELPLGGCSEDDINNVIKSIIGWVKSK